MKTQIDLSYISHSELAYNYNPYADIGVQQIPNSIDLSHLYPSMELEKSSGTTVQRMLGPRTE